MMAVTLEAQRPRPAAGAAALRDPARLRALAESRLWSEDADDGLDRVTRLAAEALSCPVALVSLLDAGSQMIKASVGLGASGAPRRTPASHAYCRFVVEGGAPFMVSDAATDPRVRASATGRALRVRAYLGVPLVADGGAVLGALCVIDRVPREWAEREVAILRDLAATAMVVVRLRAEAARRERAEALLRERQDLLDRALAAAPGAGTWIWDEARGVVRVDANLTRLLGLDPAAAEDGLPAGDCLSMVLAADRDAVSAAAAAAWALGEPLSCECRIVRPDGRVVWVQASGGRHDGGRLSGIAFDVTSHRAALERQEEISGELAHRAKNMLATVQAVVTQTLREAPSLEAARGSVVERLHALAKAHELLVARGWEGADVAEVAARVAETFGPGRFDLDGPATQLSPRRALALSMALHELATNAVKYGALSNGTGRVRMAWGGGGEAMALTWAESGGPAVVEPSRRGFGSRLLHRLLSSEIGGAVVTEFRQDGLVCRIGGVAEAS